MADATCIECGNLARLVCGKRIYPHRPDLYGKNFYLCQCGAYCGTHRGTSKPLGYPCGPVTRKARLGAHDAFDRLWRGKDAPMRRGDAYRWLAEAMNMTRDECHIGMMTAEQAGKVRAASLAELSRQNAEPQP
jgi:hypothetical protein